jgi:lysophospholipase L1-like esterase
MRIYLALGDSYTIAEGLPIEDSYPVQTVRMLNQPSSLFSVPVILARTGWTTGDLSVALDRSPIRSNPFDVVSLLIGVNNQYQGLGLGQYTQEFSSLLGQAIRLSANRPSRVYVLSIPDYSTTPFGRSTGKSAWIATQIAAFNAINRKISDQYQVNYLDVAAQIQLHRADPAWLASDGLHYSALAYRSWAASLAAAIRQQLEGSVENPPPGRS